MTTTASVGTAAGCRPPNRSNGPGPCCASGRPRPPAGLLCPSVSCRSARPVLRVLHSPSRLPLSPLDVDDDREFGVVELDGDIVGVAHYFTYRTRPDWAEIAFTIGDALQGCGVATKLLEALAQTALLHGIRRYEAEGLTDNTAMLDVFRSMGFDLHSRSADGAVHLSFSIEPTTQSDDLAAARSQTVAHNSMGPIFAPRSIAVIGTSRRKGNLGNRAE